MPNYGLLATGQQAATTVGAPLPTVVPPNPYPGGGQVRGEGVQVLLENLKGSANSFYYGNNANVAASGNNAGKEVAPGTQDPIVVNDLAQIFIVAAANGTATASWSVTNR